MGLCKDNVYNSKANCRKHATRRIKTGYMGIVHMPIYGLLKKKWSIRGQKYINVTHCSRTIHTEKLRIKNTNGKEKLLE